MNAWINAIRITYHIIILNTITQTLFAAGVHRDVLHAPIILIAIYAMISTD